MGRVCDGVGTRRAAQLQGRGGRAQAGDGPKPRVPGGRASRGDSGEKGMGGSNHELAASGAAFSLLECE